jgi:hypothetical protein
VEGKRPARGVGQVGRENYLVAVRMHEGSTVGRAVTGVWR